MTDDIFKVMISKIKVTDNNFTVLHALHASRARGLATRKLSLRFSVHPSVKSVHCDKTEERYVQTSIQKTISLVF